MGEGLTVKAAMAVLGLSRSSYYRHVRGMIDYKCDGRKTESTQHAEVLREVALKRVEAGHRRVRAYAIAWGKLLQDRAASSRMSCYRVLKREGLIQPKRIGHDLRETAERRRQMLKAPEKLNEVLQGDFTDYVTEDGEKYRIGCITEYLSRFNLVSEVLDTETALDLIAVTEAALREITELGHELAKGSGLDLELNLPEARPGLPAAVEVAAYRVAQEALTNVVRHAGASACQVVATITPETLTVQINDDGCGSVGARPGVGMGSMRERAREIGGRVEVEALARGTSVTLRLPLRTGAAT